MVSPGWEGGGWNNAGWGGTGAPAPPSSKLAGFDDNQYTLGRRNPVGPPPTKKKSRHPALKAMVVTVLALAAAFFAYRFTHPSPLRSPTSAAVDFYTQLQHGHIHAAAAAVEPQQQTAAAGAMTSPTVRQFVKTALDGGVVDSGTTTADGADTSVVLQECGSGLSCSPMLAVPTVRVAGSWYVDWNTWLQTLAPASGPPPG